MFNLKLQDTDLCRLCKETAETPLHLICSCPALMHKRSTLLGKYIIQPEYAKLLPARKVLLFLAVNQCLLRDLDSGVTIYRSRST
ncbi:jg9299 [Pararge aegeria aegeria]|uniref:Jg9299 protein n=1 Tax=Pararge aegeria aegeria TaxID=348720 RepID=A0A8S4SLU7_9NEOP|nr:jg9299 [Pararge aegeria aegeria]